jgi:hypothetical protein
MLVTNPNGRGGEPKTPLQSTFEEGEDIENTNNKCYGSNN